MNIHGNRFQRISSSFSYDYSTIMYLMNTLNERPSSLPILLCNGEDVVT